jgi:hypothetical protein
MQGGFALAVYDAAAGIGAKFRFTEAKIVSPGASRNANPSTNSASLPIEVYDINDKMIFSINSDLLPISYSSIIPVY